MYFRSDHYEQHKYECNKQNKTVLADEHDPFSVLAQTSTSAKFDFDGNNLGQGRKPSTHHSLDQFSASIRQTPTSSEKPGNFPVSQTYLSLRDGKIESETDPDTISSDTSSVSTPTLNSSRTDSGDDDTKLRKSESEFLHNFLDDVKRAYKMNGSTANNQFTERMVKMFGTDLANLKSIRPSKKPNMK
jgi:hypothetical protein